MIEVEFLAPRRARFRRTDRPRRQYAARPGRGAPLDWKHVRIHRLSHRRSRRPATSTLRGLTVFKADDFEHSTRSARDLTLVQTASITLRQAVDAASAASPGGFVYWAIPTIRDTRSGYGVYVYGADKKAHYFFVS